jgi:hypothetical protein
MEPADQALVQRHLAATLAKVSAMQRGFLGAKKELERQEKELRESTATSIDSAPPVEKIARSPSILSGDVDMTKLNAAIKKLTAGCDCPNIQGSKFLPQQGN